MGIKVLSEDFNCKCEDCVHNGRSNILRVSDFGYGKKKEVSIIAGSKLVGAVVIDKSDMNEICKIFAAFMGEVE